MVQCVEGVIENVNVDVDGFTYPIEVVVMEMKGADIIQMILWKLFPPLLKLS